eukprot:48297_1
MATHLYLDNNSKILENCKLKDQQNVVLLICKILRKSIKNSKYRNISHRRLQAQTQSNHDTVLRILYEAGFHDDERRLILSEKDVTTTQTVLNQISSIYTNTSTAHGSNSTNIASHVPTLNDGILNEQENDTIQCERCTLIQSSRNSLCDTCKNRLISIQTNEWQCSACTFIQPLTNRICQMCGTNNAYHSLNPELSNVRTKTNNPWDNDIESKMNDMNDNSDPYDDLKLNLQRFCHLLKRIGKITQTNNRSEMQCNAYGVENCDHLVFITSAMRQYQPHTCIDYDINEDQKISILNSFHHLLRYHDKSDSDFHSIFNAFGGDCTLSKCDAVRRHYSDDTEQTISNIHCSDIQSLYDKIHCHFQHSYHVFRLTRDEHQRLARRNRDSFRETQRILNDKRNAFRKSVQSNRMITANKFTSNIQSIAAERNNIISYSYSFNFTYCTVDDEAGFDEKVSDLRHGRHSDGLMGWESVVTPKYHSLKDEVLNNEIASINMHFWNKTVKEGKLHHATAYCRNSYVANTNNNNDYRRFYFHPCHFGYKDGVSSIEQKHIQCIIIYCGQDEFQMKYSASYRAKDKNEGWKEIKARHTHFYHFARTIREAVEVFGTLYRDGDIESIYHGIDKEMIFDGMQARIYSPLSTTTSENVAQIFADSHGLILELKPNATVKYFECGIFSRFANEQEILFIGGIDLVNFVNIKNVIQCCDFRPYVTALRMIDTMIHGLLFSENITKEPQKDELIVVDEHRVKKLQSLTKRLVEHQLSKSDQTIPSKYRKYDDLPEYIDHLLEGVCARKHKVWYDWDTMNYGLLNEMEVLHDGNVGYLGYDCLFQYLCNEHYAGIDLNVNMRLFPSVQKIVITHLSRINKRFIDHVFDYLSKKETLQQIKSIDIRIHPELGMSNIEHILQLSARCKFAKIGYQMSRSYNSSSTERILVFERLPGVLSGLVNVVIDGLVVPVNIV